MTLTIAQRQHIAVTTLALQAARKAVKHELKAQGRRLPDIEHKEIVMLAHDYFAQHPGELLAQARAVVDQWSAEGRFGPRGGFRVRR
jgi:hypothetical protein